TLQRLQLFAGLEADRLAGRDRHLDARLRVAPDAALAIAHLEDAEAAQLDPLAARQRVLDRVEDGVDRFGRLDARDVARVGDAVDDVRFDHRLLLSGRRESSKHPLEASTETVARQAYTAARSPTGSRMRDPAGRYDRG